MQLNQFRQLVLGLFIIVTLGGCAVAAISAVTIATVDIIHDRRTVGEYIDDSAIEVKARNYLLANAEIRKNTHVKALNSKSQTRLAHSTPFDRSSTKLLSTIKRAY